MVERGEMDVTDISLDMLYKILHQFEVWYPRMRKLVMRGIGEPSLYPHLEEAIKMIKFMLPHTQLSMATNGIALTQSIRELLIVNFDEVIISVNHYNAESYLAMNGVDQFDIVVANAKAFLREKGNRNPRIKIQLLDTDVSRPHQNQFATFWKQHLNENDALNFQLFENIGGRIDAKQFDTKSWGIDKRYPCGQLWKNISITQKGDVYPCCLAGVAHDDIKLGNINEDSLYSLLTGSELASIRKAHKKDDYSRYPTCEACDLWRKTLNSFFHVNGRWI